MPSGCNLLLAGYPHSLHLRYVRHAWATGAIQLRQT